MVAAVHRVRTQFGLVTRGEAEVRPWVNAGMDTLYRSCFDDFLAAREAAAGFAEVRDAYEANYHAHIAIETRLYPGMAKALAALAEIGPLACVTNKPERLSLRLLEALDVAHLFGAIIGGDTCADSKPNPIMLEEAAHRTGHPRGENNVFMIGDTTADIRMGKAYGAVTVWCAWGYATASDEPAAHIARTPEELPAIVQSARRA